MLVISGEDTIKRSKFGLFEILRRFSGMTIFSQWCSSYSLQLSGSRKWKPLNERIDWSRIFSPTAGNGNWTWPNSFWYFMTTHPLRLWRCCVSAKSKTKFKDEAQKHIPTSIETFVMQICPRWYAIPLNFLSLLVVLYALATALKFSGAVPDLKERSFVLAVVRPFSCTKSVAPRSRKLHLNSSFDTQTLERGSVGIHKHLQSINLSSQSFVQNPESRPWTLVNLGFISLFWHFIGVRYHFRTRLSHIIIIWAPPIFLSHQNYNILITY